MTARSLRSGEDADEFDVEEALALVKEDNGAHRAPAPPPQASGRASEPHAHHKATPGPRPAPRRPGPPVP